MNSDLSLISRVTILHDKRAFDQLVRKYQLPVRRFFLSQTLGDEQLSDDLAQETFIKAYTHLTTFRGLSGFQSWLFRIAYNVFYDYTRSKKPTSDIDDPGVRISGTSQCMAGEHMDIYKALEILSEAERTCITLQIIDGYPIDKIHEMTGMAEGTVKSHLYRGKEKLTHYLKQNGYDRR